MKIVKITAMALAFMMMSIIMSTNVFADGENDDDGDSSSGQIATSCAYNAKGTAKVTGSGNTCAKAKDLATKIEGVVKTMTGLVGAFAVGMIVYGGFKYITSQGDPKAAETAKNIIWYAGVGLFIVLLAFMIFRLMKLSIIS